MQTYDNITDQFNPQLSDLAKQMYAVLFNTITKPRIGITYLASWHIEDALCLEAPTGDDALRELVAAHLISELPNLGCRYELTAKALLVHLLDERAHLLDEREQHAMLLQGIDRLYRTKSLCVSERTHADDRTNDLDTR